MNRYRVTFALRNVAMTWIDTTMTYVVNGWDHSFALDVATKLFQQDSRRLMVDEEEWTVRRVTTVLLKGRVE